MCIGGLPPGTNKQLFIQQFEQKNHCVVSSAPVTAPTSSTKSKPRQKQVCVPATAASWKKLHVTSSVIKETARLEGWSNATGNGQIPGVCYDDSAGHATVGYVHLLSLHSCQYVANTPSSEGYDLYHQLNRTPLHEGGTRAYALLKSDLKNKALIPIESEGKRQITQRQLNALLPWVYNIGGGGLLSSDALGWINACQFNLVPSDFDHFDHVEIGGKFYVSCGLYARDKVSENYWNTGVWVSRARFENKCPSGSVS